jgi:DNA polymerase III psi subunit
VITYKTHSSTNTIPDSWDALVNHDVFLQTTYFKALEDASPKNISWYYIGVFNNEELVGVAMIQHAQLYLKDMFRTQSPSYFKQILINGFSKVLRGNILVVGNLMHTGQHGLFFLQNKVSQTEFLNAVFEALKKITNEIKIKLNKKIRIIMLKDFFIEDDIDLDSKLLKLHRLHTLQVQPNMLMNIHPSWYKKEDYVNSLNKKYRTRNKRAKKKFGTIQKKELNIETIQNNSKQLYQLYKNVSDNAKFNTFVLPENHFLNLKIQLKENFKIFGYYLNNELIGFYTLIINNSILETYFLGYDKEHQYSNQLYLNMLYDMIDFAIENKQTSIVYARTAMEIKSSVGAKPKEMIMHIKHTNKIANSILKKVFNLMKPPQQWEERHPFKT